MNDSKLRRVFFKNTKLVKCDLCINAESPGFLLKSINISYRPIFNDFAFHQILNYEYDCSKKQFSLKHNPKGFAFENIKYWSDFKNTYTQLKKFGYVVDSDINLNLNCDNPDCNFYHIFYLDNNLLHLRAQSILYNNDFGIHINHDKNALQIGLSCQVNGKNNFSNLPQPINLNLLNYKNYNNLRKNIEYLLLLG